MLMMKHVVVFVFLFTKRYEMYPTATNVSLGLFFCTMLPPTEQLGCYSNTICGRRERAVHTRAFQTGCVGI